MTTQPSTKTLGLGLVGDKDTGLSAAIKETVNANNALFLAAIKRGPGFCDYDADADLFKYTPNGVFFDPNVKVVVDLSQFSGINFEALAYNLDLAEKTEKHVLVCMPHLSEKEREKVFSLLAKPRENPLWAEVFVVDFHGKVSPEQETAIIKELARSVVEKSEQMATSALRLD